MSEFLISARPSGTGLGLSNCGDEWFHKSASFITSINHPNHYFSNSRCDWKIQNTEFRLG